jgi:hypothetical protein
MSPAGVGLGGLARYQNPTRCAAGRTIAASIDVQNRKVVKLLEAIQMTLREYDVTKAKTCFVIVRAISRFRVIHLMPRSFTFESPSR